MDAQPCPATELTPASELIPATELTPESAAFLDQLTRSGAPPLEELTPATARAQSEAATKVLVAPFAGAVHSDDLEVAGADGPLPARHYRPEGAPASGAPGVVYLHGGGWVAGTLDTYDDLCRRLAAASGGGLVAVDYRLAPEHPFPAAPRDAVAATRDVLARAGELGLDAHRVAVAGDSAGAALAAVAARHAVEEAWPVRPVGQLLAYPVTSAEEDWPSTRAYATGHYLTAEGMRWYWDHYAGDDARDDPDALPLAATDLRGLAQAHVLVASHDVLRDQGLAYARRLHEAGVPVTVEVAQGLLHGFLRWTAVIPEAAHHIERCGAVLRRWWGDGDPRGKSRAGRAAP
jgi:acetyl esterase